MKKQGKVFNANDFYAGLRSGYTLNQVNNTKHIKCTKSNFEYVNPVPGEDKICMCDQKGLLMNAAQQW